MLAWVSFDERRRGWDYAGALAWFVVALLCKSSVVMWPVVILLYAWWKHGCIGRGDILTSLPFFAVSLAASVTTYLLQGNRAIGTETFPLGGVASRCALAGLNIVFYLGKTDPPGGSVAHVPAVAHQSAEPRSVSAVAGAGGAGLLALDADAARAGDTTRHLRVGIFRG